MKAGVGFARIMATILLALAGIAAIGALLETPILSVTFLLSIALLALFAAYVLFVLAATGEAVSQPTALRAALPTTSSLQTNVLGVVSVETKHVSHLLAQNGWPPLSEAPAWIERAKLSKDNMSKLGTAVGLPLRAIEAMSFEQLRRVIRVALVQVQQPVAARNRNS